MKDTRRGTHRALVPVFVLVLLACGGQVFAGDIDDASFGNRLNAAISRFSRFTDVMGMAGASAGSKWSSSINPAATDWAPAVGESSLGASFQWAGVKFGEGMQLNLGSLTAVIDTEEFGCFQPSFLLLGTNRETMSDGLDFEWDAWSAELQWGIREGDLGFGINVSYLESEIQFGVGSTNVVESDSTTITGRIGLLSEVAEQVYVGVVFEFASNPSKSVTYDLFGEGFGKLREEDSALQFQFRPGVYFHITEDLTSYVDYQFGYFGDGSGALRVHRFYGGLDQTIIDGLYLRAGAVVDIEGNVSGAIGVGIVTSKSEDLLIDIAYQYNAFPEIEPEFGKAHLFGIGVTIRF